MVKRTITETTATCIFVQIRRKPGSTYTAADAIALHEIHSELQSTSDDDLLMKRGIPEGDDIGKWANENLLDIGVINGR